VSTDESLLPLSAVNDGTIHVVRSAAIRLKVPLGADTHSPVPFTGALAVDPRMLV